MTRRAARAGAAMLLPVLLLAAGCAAHRNYYTTNGPRYAGCCVPLPEEAPDTLTVVTYNIKFSQHVNKAIRVLRETPECAKPDVLFLQEMDERGVHDVAKALKLNYVYWPATTHPANEEHFGNAILARWPIRDDRKILLPHLGQFGGTLRIAVTGRVTIGGREIQLYSFHLATPIELGPVRMRDQVDRVCADADSVARATGVAILMAGDTNKSGMWREFEDKGFTRVTAERGATTKYFRLDHVFVRGLPADHDSPSGIVQHPDNPSDHKPVWARVALAAPVSP